MGMRVTFTQASPGYPASSGGLSGHGGCTMQAGHAKPRQKRHLEVYAVHWQHWLTCMSARFQLNDGRSTLRACHAWPGCLAMGCCTMPALPTDISTLTALTCLNPGHNWRLSSDMHHVAGLPQLGSLIARCRFTALPAALATLEGAHCPGLTECLRQSRQGDTRTGADIASDLASVGSWVVDDGRQR